MAIAPTPVVRCPLEIPAGRLARVVGSWAEPALLESGPGSREPGRWSILAARPRLVFEATGDDWTIRSEGAPAESGRGDLLEVLADLLARFEHLAAGGAPGAKGDAAPRAGIAWLASHPPTHRRIAAIRALDARWHRA